MTGWPALIDTHCHLDEDSFTPDLVEVVARARATGVVAMITLGTTASSSRAVVALARQHAGVYCAVGIHPNYCAAAAEHDWEAIESLSTSPCVKAIGETGLDRYWDSAPIELQTEYFRRHINLARRSGKPFVVHCRSAEPEVLAVLHSAAAGGALAGVMHAFSGTEATARAALELGLHISFAGMVTFKKSEELRRIAALVPSERILVETDSPYLAPAPHRGKRNEPSYVRQTAACVAEARGVSVDELCRLTTANARRLFDLPDDGPSAA